MEQQSFGTRLAQLRRAAAMSQQQLAEQLHVTRQAVSRWEQDRTQPDIATLQGITQALGCNLEQLITGLDEDAACQKKAALWRRATQSVFWCRVALCAVLVVLFIATGQAGAVVLPGILLLCDGTIYPLFSTMEKSGDYTLLAGYDPSLHYDYKKLGEMLRAMNLCIQINGMAFTALCALQWLLPGGWAMGTVILSYTISLVAVIFVMQYKYSAQIITDAKERQAGRAQQPPLLVWGGVFCAQMVLVFFLAGHYHIPNNTSGALAQGVWSMAGMGLGLWFLFRQMSLAKKAFEAGERWRINRGGWLLLAGTAACGACQWLAAIGWAQRV